MFPLISYCSNNFVHLSILIFLYPLCNSLYHLYHSIHPSVHLSMLFVILSIFPSFYPFCRSKNPYSPFFCHSFHLSIIRLLIVLSVCERDVWVHYVRFRFGTACGYIKRTDLMRAKSLLHIQMYYQENHVILISVYLCCGFSASYPYLINISFVGIMSKLIIRTVPLHVDLEILRW